MTRHLPQGTAEVRRAALSLFVLNVVFYGGGTLLYAWFDRPLVGLVSMCVGLLANLGELVLLYLLAAE